MLCGGGSSLTDSFEIFNENFTTSSMLITPSQSAIEENSNGILVGAKQSSNAKQTLSTRSATPHIVAYIWDNNTLDWAYDLLCMTYDAAGLEVDWGIIEENLNHLTESDFISFTCDLFTQDFRDYVKAEIIESKSQAELEEMASSEGYSAMSFICSVAYNKQVLYVPKNKTYETLYEIPTAITTVTVNDVNYSICPESKIALLKNYVGTGQEPLSIDLSSVTYNNETYTIVGAGDMFNVWCNWESRWGDLQKITIQGNIDTIWDYLFLNSLSLTEVIIPSTVTSIGKNAFNFCSLLESVNLSEVTSIGDYAFSGCSLTSVNLSNKVTSIGESAFSSCELLTDVGDLSQVTSIGRGAFSNCSLLERVNLSKVTGLGSSVFNGCSSLTDVGDLSQVSSIGNYAFNGCSSLTTINLSEVTSIGNNAFNGCSLLTSVGDLSQVSSIGNEAFSYCSALTTVDLRSVTSIPDYAFSNCSLLERVNLSEVTSIGNFAFFACSALTDVGALSEVTSIGESAFYGCSSLTTVTLGNGVSIDRAAFYNCSALTTVTLGNGISIGQSAFSACSSLTTVTIGDSSSIGNYSFQYCTSLSTIILGKITSIGSNVFNYANISTVYYTGTQSDRNNIGFGSSNPEINNATWYYAGEWEYDANGNPVATK